MMQRQPFAKKHKFIVLVGMVFVLPPPPPHKFYRGNFIFFTKKRRVALYGAIPDFFILQRGRTNSENHRGVAAREFFYEEV